MKKILYRLAKWYIEKYTEYTVISKRKLVVFGVDPISQLPMTSYRMHLVDLEDVTKPYNYEAEN